MSLDICRSIFREMRIHQWTKNILVYAALLFGGELFQPDALLLTTRMFLAFSLTASGVYFLNDIFDYEKDKVNPEKCHRPIASGRISRKSGIICAIVLFLAGIGFSWKISLSCTLLVLSYIIVNIAYTVHWKHVVIMDVMMVAYGFVARAVAGAFAIDSEMTTWFLLCVMFLSLFLALGKRRHELLALQENRLAEGRKVLQYYSLGFIDQLMTIVTASLLMCYVLFAMDSLKDGSAMAFTIPLVLYGVFYYLYIVRVKKEGGSPDKVLYKEKPILIVVLLYILAIVCIRAV